MQCVIMIISRQLKNIQALLSGMSAKRDRKGVFIPLPPTPPGIRVRTMAVTKSVEP